MNKMSITGDDIKIKGKSSHIVYFSLFGENETQDFEALYQRIRDHYPNATFEEEAGEEHHIFRDFKIVREFLHGGGLPFASKRILLMDRRIGMEKADVCKMQMMCTIFPEINICKLTFNFQFEAATTSQLVYLHHCNGNGAKIIFSEESSFSVQELLDQFMRNVQLKGRHFQKAYLVEINSLGDMGDVSRIMKEESKRLYGIISGDEGWNYIPESLAEDRIKTDWSSREYVSFTAFGENFLLLNLIDSEAARQYRENQRNFGSRYYGGINPYFTIDPVMAGLNHGIMYAVETVMAVKTIAHRILQIQASLQSNCTGKFHKDIERTKAYRRELISTLNRVENIDMTELGELEKVVLSSQQISPIIDKIKYLLELLESELDLMYQTRTNSFVNLLTILGLVLAVAGLVLAWIDTFGV